MTYNLLKGVLTDTVYTRGNVRADGYAEFDGYVRMGINPASAGQIRILNNPGTIIAQRNSGNSADLAILSANTTDGYFGSDASKANNFANVHIAPTTSTNIYTGSTLQVGFTSSLNTFTNPIAIGTTPATAGYLRVPYSAGLTTVLGTRNSIAADVSIISQTGNSITFGIPSNDNTIVGFNNVINPDNSLSIRRSGIEKLLINNTMATFSVPITMGTNPASAGQLLFANNLGTIINQRNSGNSADLVALSLNTTDGYLGSDTSKATNLSNIHIAPSTSTNIYTGSTLQASFTSSLATFTQPISLGGGTVASAGQMRLANNTGNVLTQRNAPNSGDLILLQTSTADLFVGSGSGGAGAHSNVYVQSGGSVNLSIGGSNYLTASSSAVTCGTGITLTARAAISYITPTGGIGAASTDGIVLGSSQVASSGIPVMLSGRQRWSGYAWNSSGSASEQHEWINEAVPVTNAGTTTSYLRFSRQISGGGYTDVARFNSDGSISIGSGTYASLGKIKLTNNPGIIAAQRNVANNADLALMSVNTTDGYFGSDTSKATNLSNIHIAPNNSTNIYTGSTLQASITSSLNSFTNPIAIGTNPASAGQIRLENNTTINFRNAANSADLNALVNDSSNNLFVGSGSGGANAHTNVYVQGSTTANLAVAGSVVFVAGATTVRSVNPIQYGSIGNTTSSTGQHRFANNPGVVMAQRNNGNSADLTLLATSATDVYLGSDSAGSNASGAVRIYPTTAVLFGNANTTVGQFDTTNGWFNNGYKITWNSSYSTPKLMQDDLSTNSGTGNTLTIQAQNETGTTSTGGALNLTSGTGTSTHGALNLQIGGTSKFSIGADGYNTITSKAGIFIENGNAKFTDTNIKISATTTDATITNLYTWTIPTGISSIDAIVTAIKSDNSQGATYKRSIIFRNNSGTVATIGTVTDNGTFEDNSAWDCTIDNVTTTGRIRVTGAASTNITWHLSSFRHEGIS